MPSKRPPALLFKAKKSLDGKSYNEVFMGIKVNALPILDKAPTA
jgi:hypothetical protein